MNYYEQLKNAVDYASKTGSFSKYNICKNAKNVCIFGLGTFFNEAFFQYNMKEKYNVNLLCDNNSEKWDKEFYGLKCVSPEELKKYDDLVIIPLIGSPIGLKKVEIQLNNMGLKFLKAEDLFYEDIADIPNDLKWFSDNQRILESLELLKDEESKRIYTNVLCNRIAPHLAKYNFWEMFSDGEYFSTGLFDLSTDESFVDCGAYTGDTVERFLHTVNGKFSDIYAFELENTNYNLLSNYVENCGYKNIKCYNSGVWNENAVLSYGKEEKGSPAGFSLLKGDNLIENKVVKLDDELKDEKVTLIKMDIEGSELNALKGAENIIKTQKPKLTICLYHKLDDFWTIPMYLKSIVEDYKFSVRHHHYGKLVGTVLYAY